MLARIHTRLTNRFDGEREGGFTLIELLVVIIIIGILAAIAIPVYLAQRNKAYDAQAKADLHNVATDEESFLTDNNLYSVTFSLATPPTTPSTTTIYYKKSPSVNMVTGEFLTSTGAKSSTATAAGYCLSVTVPSNGHVWVYNSMSGGLQSLGTKCP